jgi:hypothetical protein
MLFAETDYMSQLAATAHGSLDCQLDWDNRGVERDLHEISKVLVDWKEKLCDHMQLKTHEVYDIEHGQNKDNLLLQR